MTTEPVIAPFTKDKNSDMDNFISWEEVNLKKNLLRIMELSLVKMIMRELNTHLSGMGLV